jgi:hypothetical protein
LFEGKLLVICNSFPRTLDAEAVKNRSLDMKIEPGVSETRELLTLAAQDVLKFPDQITAKKALRSILSELNEETVSKISYRNLQKAYEIAVHNPDTWESVSGRMSVAESPLRVVEALNDQGLKVKDQLKEFERRTGFRRRSFFKYRKQLGLGEE